MQWDRPEAQTLTLGSPYQEDQSQDAEDTTAGRAGEGGVESLSAGRSGREGAWRYPGSQGPIRMTRQHVKDRLLGSCSQSDCTPVGGALHQPPATF